VPLCSAVGIWHGWNQQRNGSHQLFKQDHALPACRRCLPTCLPTCPPTSLPSSVPTRLITVFLPPLPPADDTMVPRGWFRQGLLEDIKYYSEWA